SATISWELSSILQFQYLLLPAGSPAPTEATTGINGVGSSFGLNGLTCGSSYDFYVRRYCPPSVYSTWSAPVTFNTMVVGTGPGNNLFPLIQCDEDNNGTVIFDFTTIQAQ